MRKIREPEAYSEERGTKGGDIRLDIWFVGPKTCHVMSQVGRKINKKKVWLLWGPT